MESSQSAGFSAIAGHPALDLCNTVDWRLEPASRFERLTSYDAVLSWSCAVDLLSFQEGARLRSVTAAAGAGGPGEQQRSAAERELRLLREVREAAYTVVVDRSETDAKALSRLAADSVRACCLAPGPGGAWDWAEPELTPATPRHRVLIALVDLLRSPAMRHVRRCADASCGWVYLDTSRRKNRVWCVAGDCGNRNRVRRHYERRRGQAQVR